MYDCNKILFCYTQNGDQHTRQIEWKRWQQFEKFSNQNYSERCFRIEKRKNAMQIASVFTFIRTIIAHFNIAMIFSWQQIECWTEKRWFLWMQLKDRESCLLALFCIQSEAKSSKMLTKWWITRKCCKISTLSSTTKSRAVNLQRNANFANNSMEMWKNLSSPKFALPRSAALKWICAHVKKLIRSEHCWTLNKQSWAE